MKVRRGPCIPLTAKGENAMDQVTCHACEKDVVPDAPNPTFWAMISAFWVASVFVGLTVAIDPSYGLALMSGWAVLAATVGIFARNATSWTCPECDSTVMPPADAAARMQAERAPRHAHGHKLVHA